MSRPRHLRTHGLAALTVAVFAAGLPAIGAPAATGLAAAVRAPTTAPVPTPTTAAVLAPTAAVPAPTTAPAATPRTSLPAIESQVMCVTCKIPLLVAESAQADRERAFIQELIDRGKNEAQIKQALVGQYGPRVLALVLGLLALLLPRWRRRGGDPGGGPPPGHRGDPLSPTDAARLEADLARFD